MKVLAVSESFLPGRDGGGPVRALHNLSAHLPEECQLSILTRNRDYLHPETYPDLPSDQWIEGEHSGICYASDSRWWAIYRNSIREWKPDWIYLNGLFAPMSRKILGNRSGLEKFVLAPHGNLGPAALNKGKFKKKIWLWQACRRGYFNQVRWHAASEREAAQIRRNVDQNAEILTVPMAPASMQEPWGPDDVEEMKSKDGLRLVYFGRLSSEKNLDFALQCLRDFAREQPGIRVNYDIYYIGPRAPHLEARAREIGGAVNVDFIPGLDPDALHRKLREGDGYDAMFMPSLSENFSYAVLEALQAGIPPLISDQTPWRDLETNGIGWDLPLADRRSWLAVLRLLAEQEADGKKRRRNKARAYADAWAKDYPKQLEALFA